MCQDASRTTPDAQAKGHIDPSTMQEAQEMSSSRLWHGDFVKFFCARMLALAGSVITSVALPLLILGSSGSFFYTATVTAAATTPYLVFGLVAGALADRHSRKRMIITSQLVAAASLTTIPLVSAVQHTPNPAHVLAVAFVSGTCFVFFDAACFGVLPAIVKRKSLVTANSALWTSGSLIDVSLPAIAGVAVAALGAAKTIGIEATMLIITAGIFSSLRAPLDAAATKNKQKSSMRHDIADGISFIWGNPLLKSLTLLGAGSSVINGAIVALMAVTTQQLFGIKANDPRTGLTWAAVAIGAAAAAMSLPVIRRRVAVGRITTYAISAYPLVLVTLVYIPWNAGKFVALSLWGAAVSLVVLNGITIRQELTPLNLQGRVNTIGRMVAWGGTPIGAIGGGVVAATYSPVIAINSAATVSMILVVAVWFSILPWHREST